MASKFRQSFVRIKKQRDEQDIDFDDIEYVEPQSQNSTVRPVSKEAGHEDDCCDVVVVPQKNEEVLNTIEKPTWNTPPSVKTSRKRRGKGKATVKGSDGSIFTIDDKNHEEHKTRSSYKKQREKAPKKSGSKKHTESKSKKNKYDDTEEMYQVGSERPQPRKHNKKKRGDEEDDFDCDNCGSSEVDDFVGGYDFQDFDEDTHINDFSCLSPEEIIAAQKRQVTQIAEVLQISVSSASNLLRSYGWKSEKLLVKYFDDPEKILEEAGLLVDNNHTGESVLLGEGECLVCTDDVSPSESCALTCEHRICNGCWDSYLTMKITEGEVQRVSCPALDCRLAVPDEVVKKLVDKSVFEKYLHFVTKSFVEDNTHVTWCPAPGCGNAITSDMINGQVVQCTCGFLFCFSCHHEAHAPASCDQVRQWVRKCNDDSETGHWMGANTKDCPRCGVSVEKNGGCNHMTCRQCTYEWCWMCTKVWRGHDDFYSCSRFEKAEKKKVKLQQQGGKTKKQTKLQAIEMERDNKRKALDRYIEYYDKFLEYDNMEEGGQISEKSQALIQQLQSEQTTLTEVRFIEKATETLIECIDTIKYSYVYMYFLDDDGSEKIIFLMHLENMIQIFDQLRSILEEPGILQRRTETVDLTKLAAKKRLNLTEIEVVMPTDELA